MGFFVLYPDEASTTLPLDLHINADHRLRVEATFDPIVDTKLLFMQLNLRIWNRLLTLREEDAAEAQLLKLRTDPFMCRLEL